MNELSDETSSGSERYEVASDEGKQSVRLSAAAFRAAFPALFGQKPITHFVSASYVCSLP